MEKEIKALLSKQVDGIIYVTAHERMLNCLPEELKIPAVMAYGYTKSKSFPSVGVDDAGGAYMIVNYIAGQGHKKIGVVTGEPQSIHTRARLLGYQKALFENQIFYNPDYIAEGDWTREGGCRAAKGLMEKGVTAIFCMNDLMAGGVYDALEEMGLKPGNDVAVAGYDNREIAGYYKPALTTIELPLSQIGQKACEMVIGMIDGKKNGNNPAGAGEVIEIEERGSLRIRDSVERTAE